VGQVVLGDVLSHWTVFVWKMEIKKVFFGFPSCQTSEFFNKNHQISVLGCSLAADYVEGCLIPFTFFHF
jgi:hypothetical protein